MVFLFHQFSKKYLTMIIPSVDKDMKCGHAQTWLGRRWLVPPLEHAMLVTLITISLHDLALHLKQMQSLIKITSGDVRHH